MGKPKEFDLLEAINEVKSKEENKPRDSSEETCERCFFSCSLVVEKRIINDSSESKDVPVFEFQCRFESPSTLLNGKAVWPKVSRSDWCGKYKEGKRHWLKYEKR